MEFMAGLGRHPDGLLSSLARDWRRCRSLGGVIVIVVTGDDREGEEQCCEQRGDVLELHRGSSLLGCFYGPDRGTVGWSGRLEFCWHGTSSFIDSIPSSVLPHMKVMLTAGAPWGIIPPAF
jgi:hypothetical protein